MKHYFTIEIAQKYGVNAAIILEHLCFWQQKNMANEKHFYDGRYWSYSSIKAFHKILPYLSEKQIRTAINKLKKEKVIFVAKYNKVKYDQTHWYSVDDSIYQKVIFDFDKRANGNNEKGKPIPDIITDIKTDIKADNSKNHSSFSLLKHHKEKSTNSNHKKTNLTLNGSNIEDLTTEQYLNYIEQEFKKIPKKTIDGWKRRHPNVDVDVEMAKALDWLKQHPKKRRKDIKRFIGNWLKKARPIKDGFQFQLVL